MHDHAWNDERYFASPHKGDRKFVSIDSHILCTPVIADIDADGRDEILIAATYFFDREYYDKPVSFLVCVSERDFLIVSFSEKSKTSVISGLRLEIQICI